MKTILIFLTTLLISFSIYAEKLTIYTYDSFVSEWGPGPIIEKIFEEKHNADVEFVSVDSAATLLNKVILEGDTSKADIVLGLDMNLFDLAKQSELFTTHNINDINNLINFENFANLGPYKGLILPDGLYSTGLSNFLAASLKFTTNLPS